MQLDGKQLKNGTVTADKTSGVVKADGTVAFTGNQSMGGFRLTGLPSVPTASSDAVSQSYVDAVAQGLDPKASVQAVTAAALAAYTRTANVITADANGALGAIDGQTLVVGDRLLLKDGAAGADNGIYTVTAVGDGSNPFVLTRATDADSSAKVTSGMFCFAVAGTANGLKGWALVTPDPITLNTTALTFSQLSQAAALSYGSPVAAKVGDSNSDGVATTVARSDHQHAVSRGTPVAVGTSNSGGTGQDFAAGDHVHAAPKPNVSNKNMTASVTTTDNDQATATTVAAANALGGAIDVTVNGISQVVGNGTKTSVDCYFSGDAGVTARAWSAVAAGDTLHWNGSVAGFQLAATDKINMMYGSF